MALSLTELQELLDESKRAYYAGEQRFQYRDRSITYQDPEQHWKAIQRLEREIEDLQGGATSTPSRSNLASFSRG